MVAIQVLIEYKIPSKLEAMLSTKGGAMTMKRILFSTLVGTIPCLTPCVAQTQQSPANPAAHIYNTVKQKLKEGKQVVGGTVSSSDPEIYCAMANAGFDYLWIEMQHSPLN